jgi:hypothetical protein
MNFFVQRSELRDLYDKVVAGERISEADAQRLLFVEQRFQPVSIFTLRLEAESV